MGDVHKVGPYVIGKTIGAGVTGKVRLAFDKNTGLQVAVKIVRKDLLADDEMSGKILREIAVMKVMDHPHVLHLYDFYEDLENMFLVLEYAPNGDLYDFLAKAGILSSEEALRIFHQLIEGIDYCHKRRISHRDLKPENILLDASNDLKLCDFGMCGVDIYDKLFSTSCGSPHYASPEVIEGMAYDGCKADIWSCGVILFALVTGKLPFDDIENNIVTVLEKVKAGKFIMPQELHADLQDLISKILTVDPKSRISIDEIKKHPWYTTGVSVCTESPELLEQTCTSPGGDLQEDLVKTIADLGFESVEKVEEALSNDEPSLEKSFYTILIDRLNNKRELKADKKRKGGLNRAKSEAMLPLSKMTKTFRTSSNQLHALKSSRDKDKKEKEKELSQSHQMPVSRAHTEAPKEKGIKLSREGRKSQRFLPNWLSASDAHLKKDAKGGVESSKSLDEITSEIEETLDSIGATYSFSKKRDKLKAKATKDSKSVKFTITITSHKETQTFKLSFSRKSGDKDAYAQICSNVKSLLDI